MNPFVHGALYGVVVLTVVLTATALGIWFERKLAARMQTRIGPNLVGPIGLLQPIADLLKLLQKENILPERADRALFGLAPILAALCAFGVAAVVPLSPEHIAADLDVSVLDESPESHALLDHGLSEPWEDLGGRFAVGTALEVDALIEAGIEQADVVVCSTDGDNTNIVVSQIAQKRFQVPKVVVRVHDPLRAEWYRQEGLHTVSPTQVAIEMLTDAVIGEAKVGEVG